jgi:hypothetical protein
LPACGFFLNARNESEVNPWKGARLSGIERSHSLCTSQSFSRDPRNERVSSCPYPLPIPIHSRSKFKTAHYLICSHSHSGAVARVSGFTSHRTPKTTSQTPTEFSRMGMNPKPSSRRSAWSEKRKQGDWLVAWHSTLLTPALKLSEQGTKMGSDWRRLFQPLGFIPDQMSKDHCQQCGAHIGTI